MPMTKDLKVISSYSDRQAVEDGVLVPIPSEGGVNRVTAGVFHHFAKLMGRSPSGPVINIGPLMEAVGAMVKIPPDEDGWRAGTYGEKKLWVVPNEVGGLTMMFPEDY